VTLRALTDAVGWLGAGCLLVGYALVSAGRIGADRRYQLVNLAGSIGLAVNGAVHRAWPSTVLNVVWLGIGVVALRSRRRTATSEHPR
jgi:hypothetical protein